MKKIFSLIGIMALPGIVLASPATSLLTRVNGYLGKMMPIIITLAVIYFFWGLATYILNSGDAEKEKEGRSIMIWGVVALFVMVSVWGLVGFIGDSLNIHNTAITFPTA